MKTKDGQELEVVGQVQMEKPYFIVKIPIPFYQGTRLVKFILLPITEFDVKNGAQEVEYANVAS
jgi:hypothetical protein